MASSLTSAEFKSVDELINTKAKILMITHRRPDGDAIGSMVALRNILQSRGKQLDMFCSDPVPAKFDFIGGSVGIKPKFDSLDLIVRINCQKTTVDKVSYNIIDDVLNLVVTPVSGEFDFEEVSLDYGKPNYDLIIMLDTPDLSLLGDLYAKNQQFFESTDILNIDHHVSNSVPGKLNLVDSKSPSTGEIVYQFAKYLQYALEASTATALLTAIVTDTGSFQHISTTADSFATAARLMEAGGDLQLVIENIYRRKSVATLKLWGRILSKIKQDSEHGIVWATVSQQDFKETKADEDDASVALNDLIAHVPDTKVAMVLYEDGQKQVRGSIRTSPKFSASKIAALFGGGGHDPAAGFTLTGLSLDEASQSVLTKIREHLTNASFQITAPAKETKPSATPPEPLTPEQIIDRIGKLMQETEKVQSDADTSASVPTVKGIDASKAMPKSSPVAAPPLSIAAPAQPAAANV